MEVRYFVSTILFSSYAHQFCLLLIDALPLQYGQRYVISLRVRCATINLSPCRLLLRRTCCLSNFFLFTSPTNNRLVVYSHRGRQDNNKPRRSRMRVEISCSFSFWTTTASDATMRRFLRSLSCFPTTSSAYSRLVVESF